MALESSFSNIFLQYNLLLSDEKLNSFNILFLCKKFFLETSWIIEKDLFIGLFASIFFLFCFSLLHDFFIFGVSFSLLFKYREFFVLREFSFLRLVFINAIKSWLFGLFVISTNLSFLFEKELRKFSFSKKFNLWLMSFLLKIGIVESFLFIFSISIKEFIRNLNLDFLKLKY